MIAHGEYLYFYDRIDNTIDQPMFRIDPARPVTSQFRFQSFRFANACVWMGGNIFQ